MAALTVRFLLPRKPVGRGGAHAFTHITLLARFGIHRGRGEPGAGAALTEFVKGGASCHAVSRAMHVAHRRHLWRKHRKMPEPPQSFNVRER